MYSRWMKMAGRTVAAAATFVGALVVVSPEGADALATYTYRDMPLACNVTTRATTYDVYAGNSHGKAIDFPVAGGTPVVSPVRGTAYVRTNDPYKGNWVEVVDHTTGDRHRLLHLRAQDLRTSLNGKYIAKGTMVGRVGNTGLSTGNHLHYEVRDASGRQRTVEMGGPALRWSAPSGPYGDRTTTHSLKSKNCRSQPGRWVLTNSLEPHVDTANRVRFNFGGTSYIPVAGDWDGDGIDTAGVFQPSTGRWVLTNSLQPQRDTSDRIRFKFGDRKYLPVVGDWNGDGIDTPGVFFPRNGNWVLTNSLRPDIRTNDRIRFKFGNRNYLPVAGNWDGYRGSTNDTPGVYNPLNGRWVLTNALRPDIRTNDRIRFSFGGRNYLPVAGDWDGRPGDNPGVFYPASRRWVLTNSLQPHIDRRNRVAFSYGSAIWSGVAGNWDGYPGDNAGVFAH